jgi:hypothetical protein
MNLSPESGEEFRREETNFEAKEKETDQFSILP